jgi:hypothetical protein
MNDYVILHCICCLTELKVPLDTFLVYARKHPDVEPEYACVRCTTWLTYVLDSLPTVKYLPRPK